MTAPQAFPVVWNLPARIAAAIEAIEVRDTNVALTILFDVEIEAEVVARAEREARERAA